MSFFDLSNFRKPDFSKSPICGRALQGMMERGKNSCLDDIHHLEDIEKLRSGSSPKWSGCQKSYKVLFYNYVYMYPWGHHLFFSNPNNALLQGKSLKMTIPLHLFDPKWVIQTDPCLCMSMSQSIPQKLPSQHPSPRIAAKAPRRAECSCRTSVRACATVLLSPPLLLGWRQELLLSSLAVVNCLFFNRHIIYVKSTWCKSKYLCR